MRTHALKQLDSGIARATRLDLRAETLKVFDFFEAWAEEQHVTLKISGHACWVEGDALMLRRVMNNLLSNAIRYTPAGSEVDVRLAANSLSVEDNGEGLSDADRQRLGERFWRPPGQEKSGSGLGLSIVRNIAQLHAMQLAFSQRPGSGLCVTLRW